MLISMEGKNIVNDPQSVAKIIRSMLKREQKHDQDKEHFYVIGLSGANIIKYIDLVSMGTLNASVVHPREVFRMAIARAVAGIVLVHNHLSGCATPSTEDKSITSNMRDAGKILGISVIDHVIVSDDEYFSFYEKEIL